MSFGNERDDDFEDIDINKRSSAFPEVSSHDDRRTEKKNCSLNTDNTRKDLNDDKTRKLRDEKQRNYQNATSSDNEKIMYSCDGEESKKDFLMDIDEYVNAYARKEDNKNGDNDNVSACFDKNENDLENEISDDDTNDDDQVNENMEKEYNDYLDVQSRLLLDLAKSNSVSNECTDIPDVITENDIVIGHENDLRKMTDAALSFMMHETQNDRIIISNDGKNGVNISEELPLQKDGDNIAQEREPTDKNDNNLPLRKIVPERSTNLTTTDPTISEDKNNANDNIQESITTIVREENDDNNNASSIVRAGVLRTVQANVINDELDVGNSKFYATKQLSATDGGIAKKQFRRHNSNPSLPAFRVVGTNALSASKSATDFTTVDLDDGDDSRKLPAVEEKDEEQSRLEFLENGKADRRAAVMLMADTRYPEWLRLAMKRTILSPLMACFAVGTLFIIVQFYTIFIYLTDHKLSFHQLSLVFFGAFILRFLLAPILYYILYICRRKKLFKAEGRKMIFIAGTLCCVCFALIFHPWDADFGVVQLCLSLVFFEIGLENMLFELSRVFHLQHVLLSGVSKHLNILEEVSLTTSAFVIFLLQVFSGNVADTKIFQIECLFIALLTAGCFLFAGLFFPGNAQLKLSQGRRQLVSNVTQIHRNMTRRISRVLGSSVNADVAAPVDDVVLQQQQQQPLIVGFLLFMERDRTLAQMRRLLANPHFVWPLLARCSRQARISFNTGFLFLFVKLFFVSASDFEENSVGVDVYMMLCLVLHTVFIKLLWSTIRDSGAVVLNTILTTISVGCGVLMLIFGRKYHFLAACYFLAENVLSRCGAQISYSMFQTNFQVFDRKYNTTKKPLSRKKIAFLNLWLSNCVEYLTLALMLALIGSSHLKDFIRMDETISFADRCEPHHPNQDKLSNANMTHSLGAGATAGAISSMRERRELPNLLSGLRDERNDSSVEVWKAPFDLNGLVDGMNGRGNDTQLPISNDPIALNLSATGLSDEDSTGGSDDTPRPPSASSSSSGKLPYHLCEDLLDVTFLIAVTFSLLTAGMELFAMRRYRRNFPTHSSNVVL